NLDKEIVNKKSINFNTKSLPKETEKNINVFVRDKNEPLKVSFSRKYPKHQPININGDTATPVNYEITTTLPLSISEKMRAKAEDLRKMKKWLKDLEKMVRDELHNARKAEENKAKEIFELKTSTLKKI